MKGMKRFLAFGLAAIMTTAMTLTGFAAVEKDSGKGGDASITITLPADEATEDHEYSYTIYKVFNATSDGKTDRIAYQINDVNGELTDAMTKAGFSVDTAGNVSGPEELSDDAIAAIGSYAKDEVGTFSAKVSEGPLTVTGLEYGYYYISTTTGTVVTIDSTNPNATVEDKNSVTPPPKKTITGVDVGSFDADGKKAIAQVGTTTSFSVDIEKVKGATNYVFHDKMDSSLSFNNDVKVLVEGNEIEAGADTFSVGGEGDDTLTVTFVNEWISGLTDGTIITVTYSATVTSAALNVTPGKNSATISYGNGAGYTTDPDEVEVYNAKFTVTKQDEKEEPLAGAGFVIAKTEEQEAETAESGAAGADEAAASVTKYYKIENDVVSWVDSIDEATEYISNDNGEVEAFTGLADGTYTLIEKTVPAGYNKAGDTTFQIAAGDYSEGNLQQTAAVTNVAGAELPSTGGVGTTMFYVIGSLLVIGAGVVLVSRRRMSAR